tara:strand:- start:2 stop:274 length:273 start_codon:yes stop_codon:yes gene_type:complete
MKNLQTYEEFINEGMSNTDKYILDVKSIRQVVGIYQHRKDENDIQVKLDRNYPDKVADYIVDLAKKYGIEPQISSGGSFENDSNNYGRRK